MNCLLDYSLCNQTVTLYRMENGAVTRTVVENAFLSTECREKTVDGVARQEREFLLILPGSHEVAPGDRVISGIGPEVTPETYRTFLPVSVPGLCQVEYVKPVCWQGQLCHTEAGRRQWK